MDRRTRHKHQRPRRMTEQHILTVLAKASAFDNRRPDAAAAAAWLEAIGDLPVEDALEAVVEHYATATDYLRPGHIRAIVERTRADRLRGIDQVLPPADPDAVDYGPQLKKLLARAADDRSVATAIEAPRRRATAPTAEYVAARGPGYLARRLALAVPCPLEGCGRETGRPCRVVGAGRREVPTGYHPARLEAAKEAMEATA
ncbi:hypothetical protein [Nocardiopsis sp. NPDC057823]|uniref:hypothetical protein n=1 Tax=Nocardiopsis sp. NPDC057823 TaxID=3346256 RepID=UPI00366F9FEC